MGTDPNSQPLISPTNHLDESNWTAVERDVWRQLEISAVDFNRGINDQIRPDDGAFRSEHRLLRSVFLQTIISQEPYRSTLSRYGLRINGAWIQGNLDLNDVATGFRINLESCLFEHAVDLSGIRVNRSASFDRSVFLQDVKLDDARVDGELSFWFARFESLLDAQRMHISTDLVLLNAIFEDDVDISKSQIGGQISADDVVLRKSLDIQGSRIGADVFFRRAEAGSIDLTGCEIGGQFAAQEARVQVVLDLQGAKVASDVFIGSARVQSLDMTGCKIDGELDIDSIWCFDLRLPSIMVSSTFKLQHALLSDADLNGARIEGSASIKNSRWQGRSRMNDLHVGLGLDASSVVVTGQVEVNRLACGQGLSFAGSEVYGSLLLNGARIKGNADMGRIRCTGDIELKWAHIDGLLSLSGVSITGILDMEAIQIGTNLFLRESRNADGPSSATNYVQSEITRVSLVDANVRGTIYARRSVFNSIFDLSNATAGYIWLRQSVFNNPVLIRSASVANDVDLSGSFFHDLVDCSSARIGGSLDLGSQEIEGPRWGSKAKLVLRDASAAALHDRRPEGEASARDAWPERIAFNGFVYGRLGSYEPSSSSEVQFSDRNQYWYENWMARDMNFSSGPYQQLAAVLLKQGEANKAESIRYAARERHRLSTTGGQRYGLTILKYTIGYGIGFRYLRSLMWVAGFSVLGSFVFWHCCSLKLQNFGEAWLFSVDQLLPIIKLYSGSDDVAKDMRGWTQLYLALHRTIGFLLSSFVVAGLSGLTQK